MARRTKQDLTDIQAVIAEQLSAMPDNYLVCRDPGLRHKWDLKSNFHMIPVAQVGRKVANLQRVTECERCHVRKVENFSVGADNLIDKVGQSYDYSGAPGYLMKGIGVPRGLKRSNVVWSENYRRVMEAHAAVAAGKVTPIKKRRTSQ